MELFNFNYWDAYHKVLFSKQQCQDQQWSTFSSSTFKKSSEKKYDIYSQLEDSWFISLHSSILCQSYWDFRLFFIMYNLLYNFYINEYNTILDIFPFNLYLVSYMLSKIYNLWDSFFSKCLKDNTSPLKRTYY